MDTKEYKKRVTETFHQGAPDYDLEDVDFFNPMGRRLAELASPQAGERVLDVGCGRGACLFPVAAAVGGSGKAIGIDIAPAMVEHVSRAAVQRGLPQVEAKVMDAEHPQFGAGSFELITGSFSIIFLPSITSVLPRYAQLLALGGRLAFTSPVFTENTFPFLPPMFTEIITEEITTGIPDEWQPQEVAKRICGWLYNKPDILRTLGEAGFSKVHVIDEIVPMEVSSGRAWVTWSRTNGMRLLWDLLSPDLSRHLEEKIVVAIDAKKDSGGRSRIDTPVRYVLCKRSQISDRPE